MPNNYDVQLVVDERTGGITIFTYFTREGGWKKIVEFRDWKQTLNTLYRVGMHDTNIVKVRVAR